MKYKNICSPSLLALLLIVLFVSCKKSNTISSNVLANIVYADSTLAAKLIIEEDPEGFYESLSRSDAAIQMKDTTGFATNEEARAAYKLYIPTQVTHWSDADKVFMDSVFTQANTRLQNINPSLLLPNIHLIKIKTDHYGPSVYYTRGSNIYIPENTLVGHSVEGQANIMLHEVWHILSKTHPQLKEQAYKLIGFTKNTQKITFPPALANRILTNPDGVSTEYSIDLEDGYHAIPLLIAKSDKYTPNRKNFFDYLFFDLFTFDEKGMVQVTDQLKTTLPPKNSANLFKKIGDNTQYIIHPDEILADNFMLAVNTYTTKDYGKQSPEGKRLLLSLQEILTDLKK